MIIRRKCIVDPIFRILCFAIFFQLSACGLNMGGPRAAAALYVKEMVEKPNDSLIVQQDYSKLPNRVVIDYARALYQQGVELDYETEKVGSLKDSTVHIAVTIIPKRGNSVIQERSHSLELVLKNIPNQGWRVIGFEANP